MRLGVFGGTFNPIHNGHIALVKNCAAALGLDQVLLIPNAAPPHKSGDALAPGKDRLAMCRLAVGDLPYVQVSDLELGRGGMSYTVDTLMTVRGTHPGDELFLLMGSDMFYTLQDWKEFSLIIRLASVCTLAREEDELEALSRQKEKLEAVGAACFLVEEAPFVTSSSEIRSGEKVETLPPAVLEYIRQNGLYGYDAKDYSYDLDHLTQHLRGRLSRERFVHSLNVASEALRLARHYGADQQAAYVAGLVHDACKEESTEKMLQILQKTAIMNDKTFLCSPKVMHGFAAAIFIQRELNILNTAIIDAVRYHSTGRAEMTEMDKIVYLADLVSVERDYPGVEELRSQAYQSLDKAMAEALAFSVRNLSGKGLVIFEDTFKAYNAFIGL